MIATHAHRSLCTHARLLPDGRRVTLRHAVPSDAPRIGLALGPREAAWGRDLVAFDDRGAVVGHAASAADVAVARSWAGCGLDEMLIRESAGS